MHLRSTLLCLALLFTCVEAQAQETASFVGKPMPQFAMKDLTGKKLTNSSLKGKVIVMDFWASWCVTCRRVSPIIEALHKKYGSKGLVAIGTDVAEKKSGTATKYRNHYHYTYRFTENNDKLAETLGIVPLPTVIVIDRKGIVRKVEASYYEGMEADMDKWVGKLVAEK